MASDLEKAKERYKTARDSWQEIYRKAKEDLEFLSDEPFAQWDAREANNRVTVGRPVLEVDQLSQFIHQVVNDIRMNTPSIRVIPDGEGSDEETAEIISGRIKAIEYKSNADAAYDMAAEFSVKSSIGYIRVDHDYVDDKSFLQTLKICRVINPASILIDPDSIEPDGSDAKYGFVFEEITRAEFERLYPQATPMSFGDEKPNRDLKDSDKITIAEYFCIEDEYEERGLLDDGTDEVVSPKKEYKSTRKFKKPRVRRFKFSGEDELAGTTFPGRYIPLVPVYGEEAWIEGKRYLNSLIRKSKSSQMAYNLLKSSETEILMKQQQAPVQAAVGQMRGFEEDWKNPEKAMVLYYHQTDVNGQQAPAPQRLNPPVVSSGFAAASIDAENNIRKTLGMYNAGVGKREGQSSGVALKQLEMSGDVASFHFGDNLVKSITHVGKIIVCALPEIEDTKRVVNIIGKEDEHKLVGINGAVVEGQERSYDLTKGSWDVRVTTGPSFTTQRQEAAAYYAEVIKSAPDLMPVIGDLVFKYQDAPGAQAISARLKKVVDPKLLDESERDKNQQDPAILQLTQQLQQVVQEAEQQIGELQSQLENKQSETAIKAGELQIKNKEVEIKAGELQLKAMESQKPTGQMVDNSVAEREMQLKEYQAQQEAKNQTMQNLIEIERLKLDALKIQSSAAAPGNEGSPNLQDDERTAQLAQISANIEQLTAALMQPITIIRDEAGNMTGAV